MIRAWEVMHKAGVNDIIRKNTTNLESFSKALKQEGYDATYFDNLIKSKSDLQKFLDDFISKIGDDGKFIDFQLETNYSNYLTRKARDGKFPRDRADWKQASDHMKYNSPTARENKFNKKLN